MQLILTVIFRTASNRAVADAAALGAHQVVAFFFMILASLVGGSAWWLGLATPPASAHDRLLAPNGTARWLAAVMAGQLVIWDIPCSLFMKSLRKMDAVLHHVGMAIVGYNVAKYLPDYYSLYYMGAIELSSIPLQLNDYCRLNRAVVEGPDAIPALIKLNSINQMLTAFAFLFVRLLSFSYVTLALCIPDTLATIPTAGEQKVPLQVLLVLLVAFQILQLYWGYAHGRSFLKAQAKAAKSKGS